MPPVVCEDMTTSCDTTCKLTAEQRNKAEFERKLIVNMHMSSTGSNQYVSQYHTVHAKDTGWKSFIVLGGTQKNTTAK